MGQNKEWVSWDRALRILRPAAEQLDESKVLTAALCSGAIECRNIAELPLSPLVTASPLTADWFSQFCDDYLGDEPGGSVAVQDFRAWRNGENAECARLRQGLQLARNDVVTALQQFLSKTVESDSYTKSGQWTIAQAVVWIAGQDVALSDQITGGQLGADMQRAAFEIASRFCHCDAKSTAYSEFWEECNCIEASFLRFKEMCLDPSFNPPPVQRLTYRPFPRWDFLMPTDELRPLSAQDLQALRYNAQTFQVALPNNIHQIEVLRSSVVSATPKPCDVAKNFHSEVEDELKPGNSGKPGRPNRTGEALTIHIERLSNGAAILNRAREARAIHAILVARNKSDAEWKLQPTSIVRVIRDYQKGTAKF